MTKMDKMGQGVQINVSPYSKILSSAKVLSSLTKTFTLPAKPSVESYFLRLHCTITMLLLAGGCSFLSLTNYFGDPIDCIRREGDNIPPMLLQQYCWLDGLFSVYSRDDLVSLQSLQKHHVRGFVGVKPYEYGDIVVNHRYYQWVYFVLIVQCSIFYVPRYFWQRSENKRLVSLIASIEERNFTLGENQRKKMLTTQWFDLMYRGHYFLKQFIVCDLCCLVNVYVQIFFTNVFLRWQFLSLGQRWYTQVGVSVAYSEDPLHQVFPRMAKCSYYFYGFSGENNVRDTLCYLPLNAVNEKIYVTLWFWFLLLAIIGPLFFVWRLLYLFSFARRILLRLSSPVLPKETVKMVSDNAGQWFVCYVIACNISSFASAALLEDYGCYTENNVEDKSKNKIKRTNK